ncbi:response regulator transcription factor [Cognatazoarcus halotolerans]|uniref:response regulator transcription factor n=1 Tax=Cognatazoarcus halotolerans TaxID=2686016 RepID=UPI001359CC85|nr:response regulator transcription factor [Cognatazoarcus halotolerans]MCB1900252.1 response regulator transcription factor [Rhodocyclaceae bacterium]MCP5310225.1 response regulator transcription factor [Zoogloeaceae bacterium]
MVSFGAPRVILVDDHPLVRDGIRARLEALSEAEVVGEAASMNEAVRLASDLRPDIVITDIRMPDASGITLLAHFAENFPRIRTLVLSMLKDAAYVQRAMALGARAYVLKDDPADHLIEAIRSVTGEGTYLSPGVAAMVSTCASLPQPHQDLTPKEKEVLDLLGHGHSNKEIALRLGASIRTVESHRLNLRRKLKVEGRAALVKYAVDYSDLELGETKSQEDSIFPAD